MPPDNSCPHCGTAFERPPQRKTKCKSCAGVVLVRTRPADRKRILVTPAEAEAIEQDWARKYDYERVVRTNHPDFEVEKAALTEKFGGAPKDTDVMWSILNKERLHNSARAKWGLYRNNTLDMADVLRVEGRLEGAVRFYLEVCYLDLNGPTNAGIISDPVLRAKYPPFSSRWAGLLPGVVHLLARARAKANMSNDALRSLFMMHGRQTQLVLDLPIAPEDAWRVLEVALLDAQGAASDRTKGTL